MAGRLFGGNLSGLAGKHVVITRPRPAAGCPLANALRQAGARVSEIPLVDIQAVDFAMPDLGACQWLFFTSRNAVQAFLPRVGPGPLPAIAAVGPATASMIASLGHRVDFVPGEFHAQASAEAFVARFGPQPLNILWPCGNLASPELRDILEAGGMRVTPLVVYETQPRTQLRPEEQTSLQAGVDMLVFTSPSAVRALAALLPFTPRPAIACLGPQTAQAARTVYGGLEVEAVPHTLAALAEAIGTFYGVSG